MMNIESTVIGILESITDIKIRKKKKIALADLALDSLQMVTLLIMIEDQFGIELDESDMDPFALETVADVVAMVSKYVTNSGETGHA